MKIFTLFLLSYISLSLYGQNWCPPGAVWTYNYYQLAQNGYTRFTYEKDTVLYGQPCKKLSGHIRYQPGNGDAPLSGQYTFEQNDTVYFYYINAFRPVYYWGARVGDTLYYRNLDVVGLCDSVLTQVVDSAGTLQINGETLRYYVVRNTGFSSSFIYPENMRVVERLGAVDNHLVPVFTCVTDGDDYSLRCYSDSSFALYQTNPTMACDSLVGINKVEMITEVDIYPNPAQNTLNISVDAQHIQSYQLLDVTGKSMLSGSMNADNMQLDVSALPQGIYLLKLELANGQYAVRRLVKQ